MKSKIQKWTIITLLSLIPFIFFFLFFAERNKDLLQVPKGGDFVINTHQGLFDSKTHRGETIFLFFGFTRCPYVCPTTLKTLEQVHRELPNELKKKTKILFVSVDYKRDNLDELKKYSQGRGDHFYAAAPSEDKLKMILNLFGASSSITQSDDDMIFDHTSDVFVINSKGEWVDKLDFRTSKDNFTKSAESADLLSPFWSDKRQMRLQKLLGENLECDLSKEACTIDLKDRGLFTLELEESPIKTEKVHNIKVTSTSSEYEPVAADFSGIDLNMGFIRPNLSKSKDGFFEGSFTLPLCELSEMRWLLSLIIKDRNNFYYKLNYTFITKE